MIFGMARRKPRSYRFEIRLSAEMHTRLQAAVTSPGDTPGPLRLRKPLGLVLTTGQPPVMTAPGERGSVQGRL